MPYFIPVRKNMRDNYQGVSRLHDDIDRLFGGNMFPGHWMRQNMPERVAEQPDITPMLDVTANEEAYFVHIELPGVSPEDVNIKVAECTHHLRREEERGPRGRARLCAGARLRNLLKGPFPSRGRRRGTYQGLCQGRRAHGGDSPQEAGGSQDQNHRGSARLESLSWDWSIFSRSRPRRQMHGAPHSDSLGGVLFVWQKNKKFFVVQFSDCTD